MMKRLQCSAQPVVHRATWHQRYSRRREFHLLHVANLCSPNRDRSPSFSGHGKPVDMWAIGVITYFLLCGYTPFDRDTTMEEMQAIINADYSFEPAVYWQGVSEEARDFVNKLLTIDPSSRMTANQALQHSWLTTNAAKEGGEQRDLLPDIKHAFNAKRTFKKAVNGIR